jgi:hypothetical protein
MQAVPRQLPLQARPPDEGDVGARRLQAAAEVAADAAGAVDAEARRGAQLS